MFFLGFAGVGRCSITFLYLMELIPQTKQTLIGTIVQMNGGMVAIYVALYFWFISIKWQYLEIFAACITVIGIVFVTVFIPESPKFYLSNKRFKEARVSLSYIAKFNKGGDAKFQGRFDRERVD